MTGFAYDRKSVVFSVEALFVVFEDVGIHVYGLNTQWLTLYIFLICGFVCIYIYVVRGGGPCPPTLARAPASLRLITRPLALLESTDRPSLDTT